jgi:hypothetical protein
VWPSVHDVGGYSAPKGSVPHFQGHTANMGKPFSSSHRVCFAPCSAGHLPMPEWANFVPHEADVADRSPDVADRSPSAAAKRRRLAASPDSAAVINLTDDFTDDFSEQPDDHLHAVEHPRGTSARRVSNRLLDYVAPSSAIELKSGFFDARPLPQFGPIPPALRSKPAAKDSRAASSAASGPRSIADVPVPESVNEASDPTHGIPACTDEHGERVHPLHAIQRDLAKAVSLVVNFPLDLRSGSPVSNELLLLQSRLETTRRNVASLKRSKTTSGLHSVHTKALIAAHKHLDSHIRALQKDKDAARAGLSTWILRSSLSATLSLANSVVQGQVARLHFTNRTVGTARAAADVNLGIDFVFDALNKMRVASNAGALVSVQGAGKSSAIRAMSTIDAFAVKLEDADAFMPLLTVFLNTLSTGSLPEQQQACAAAETAIFNARHVLPDPGTDYVIERAPSCCLLYGFVSFAAGQLTKKQFFDLVQRVVAEGFLPGMLWFVSENPATCSERLLARANLATDPTERAQHQAEAAVSRTYLADLYFAHELFYARNAALAARVAVIAEPLPERTSLPQYEALVRRSMGQRFVDFFESTRQAATLGSTDTLDPEWCSKSADRL